MEFEEDIPMKISLLEPIGVSKEVLDELSKGLIERGHEFTFYDTKTTDVEELKKRSAGCDIVMIANNPYPAEVVESADALKMISVAFTTKSDSTGSIDLSSVLHPPALSDITP